MSLFQLKTVQYNLSHDRNKCRSNQFQWCPLSRPCLYFYVFFIHIYGRTTRISSENICWSLIV